MRGRALAASALLLASACTGVAPRARVVPLTSGGTATRPAAWGPGTFEVLTQYSPTSTFVGQATDLSRIAESFTGILLAAGKLGPTREQAVQLAKALGLHVWLDVDLTADYAKGIAITQRLQDTAVFALQHRGVVVGIKLANEIGQNDPYAHDPALIEGYLRQVGSVLHTEAPGLPITVDMPVPDGPCQRDAPGLAAIGGSASCLARVRATFPALQQRYVDHYLSLGVLDGVFITPYLQEDVVYKTAGTDTADVLRFTYRWLKSRPWAARVRLYSRKALAFPDNRYPGSADDAARAVTRHLEVPREEGLSGADIWAWRRPFRGGLRTLLDKDGRTNALWDGLVAFRGTLAVSSPGTAHGRTPLPRAASAGTT